MAIHRIIVAPKEPDPQVFKIYNLEINGEYPDLSSIIAEFHDHVVEEVIPEMPQGKFIEVMYHRGVIDPEQEVIIKAGRKLGVEIEAAKVSWRYYGEAMQKAEPNKLVHMWFFEEPKLTSLKPRGFRNGMQAYDLLAMTDKELMELSKQRDLSLSLEQMRQLIEIQRQEKLPVVTDVFLETYAARWSDHCFHTKWKALGLFKILMLATQLINNPNLVSAFKDNAGGWKFYEWLVAVIKLETHNSPSQNEPYGGQLTKIGGLFRDIFAFGLGALIIGVLEMTVVGEFIHERFPFLGKAVLSAKKIAKDTIRAIRDYGNPMGVPMLKARMLSHPNFGAKTFVLGGAVGITHEKYAQKGCPEVGDFVFLVGGDTGNDGLHGATISSGEMTELVDAGDASHVQIGHPYTEQKLMRAHREFQEEECNSCVNDFGAAGIISAVLEPGEDCGQQGGVYVNLAAVPLKTAALENWQIGLSESQERMMYAVKPQKREKFLEICDRYELKATAIGIFTGSGRAQLVYDPEMPEYTVPMPLTGEICLDVPFSSFEQCPLPKIEVIEPPPKVDDVVYPEITTKNVQQMAEKVVSHFDLCNQAWATTQYDSTVQGKSHWGPLYGRNYNIDSPLAVSKPVYGKPYGLCLSQSFSPWQFEVDPVQAAINAMADAVVTQVVAGVELQDICLADNFYTPNLDPYAYYYLKNQVSSIAELSVELGTPFITGKDSSSGSSTKGGLVNVLPSVCITAMGKILDVSLLVPPLWQRPGNYLFLIGPQAQTLSGSILSSALGITGVGLEGMELGGEIRAHMDKVSRLVRSGIVKSAVPVNRGGLLMRLFEGVEASGLGVATRPCSRLFPESFGSVLVEVSDKDHPELINLCDGEYPMYVGTIVPEKGIRVASDNIYLDWQRLYDGWNTTFQKEVSA